MPSLTQGSDPGLTASAAQGGSTTSAPYSDATSKIVRTAVAAGVIVLALSGLVLFFKISSWIRYHQRLRRQQYLTTVLQSEQRANAYEIAAWSDEPAQAPVRATMLGVGGVGVGGTDKKMSKKRINEIRAQRRGGANAHAVHEWEGVAA